MRRVTFRAVRVYFQWMKGSERSRPVRERSRSIFRARTTPIQVKVKHGPRLLSDNGLCFVSHGQAKFLKWYGLINILSTPYHSMTQGKIERYHQLMKNVVKLETYFFPWDLELAIAELVDYYNHERYHESLDNLTPADVCFDRAEEMKDRREDIKQKTLKQRRQLNRQMAPNTLSLEWRSLSWFLTLCVPKDLTKYN